MPNPKALFKTTMGDFKVEIFVDQMPLTAGKKKRFHLMFIHDERETLIL